MNKYISCTLILLLCVGNVLPVFAATVGRDASGMEYERGQLQELHMLQELEEGLADVDSLDDYDAMPLQSIADPLEPWNRFWFGFNDIFYMYIVDPMYAVYDAVMPEPVQSGLSNFFDNLLFPVRFVNSLLQGKFQLAGVEFGRFFINTTVGMGGFIDVAKRHKTVVPVPPGGEDFAQTLGYWGFGSGFYLVWPILGPSSLRGTVGMVGNYALKPNLYVPDPWAFTYSTVEGGLRFNDLGPMLDLLKDTNEIAVDPYIAVREAYANFSRQKVIN